MLPSFLLYTGKQPANPEAPSLLSNTKYSNQPVNHFSSSLPYHLLIYTFRICRFSLIYLFYRYFHLDCTNIPFLSPVATSPLLPTSLSVQQFIKYFLHLYPTSFSLCINFPSALFTPHPLLTLFTSL